MSAVSLFVHSTGVGPVMWASVPAPVLGATEKLAPANLGYPPRPPLARGERCAAGADVALLLEALPPDGEVHVYAHSYGASVALELAPRLGARLRSLFLFEPVLFGALAKDDGADPEALAEARAFTRDRAFLDDETLGGTDPWLEKFIDYWNRPGSWARMPEPGKAATRAMGWKMFLEVRSCFFEVNDYAARPLPPAVCTLVTGARSTRAARAMAFALAARNPHARLVDLAGVGHMAPLTHPAVVGEAMLAHARAAGVAR